MEIRLDELECRNRFRGRISARWNAGDVVSVRGRTGSGKSSLLDVLTGFLAPTRGLVSYLEPSVILRPTFDPFAPPKRVRMLTEHGVGRSFQSAEVLELTVAEVLARSGRSSALTVGSAFEAVATAASLDLQRKMTTLSYGQAKAVGILSACMVGQRVVVLDEPGAGLSLPVREALSRLLDSVAATGRIVIAAEHPDYPVLDPSSIVILEE